MCWKDEECDYDCFIMYEYFEILNERQDDYFDLICEYQEEWEIDD